MTSIIEPARLRDLSDRSDAVLHAVLYAVPPAMPVSGAQSLRFGPGGAVTVLSSGISPGALRRWRESFDALTTAVRRSGGLLHRLSEGIDPFEEVLDDFRNSYVLSYRPTGVEIAGWHDVDVRVTRPGSFDIRARRGYQGGQIE